MRFFFFGQEVKCLFAIRTIPGKGRGVFATVPIAAGECFERSPVIVIPREEIIHIRRTVLADYYFKWNNERKNGAIALGHGSLFNHSYHPNAVFHLQLDDLRVDFVALRPIAPGQEITVNYNGDPEDTSRLWFHPIEEA